MTGCSPGTAWRRPRLRLPLADPAPPGRLATLLRHVPAAGWTAADQAASSLVTLLLSVGVARAGGTRLLGQFALAFTAYLLVLGFQRALVTEPLMSLPAGDRAVPRAALGSSLVFGAAVGAVVLLVGLAGAGTGLVVLGAVLPALLLQDAVRFTAFQRQDARGAAAVDLTWLLLLAVSWPLLVGADAVAVPLLLWGAGALCGALVGMAAGRLRPAGPRTAWSWWVRDARTYGGLLAVESTVYSLAEQGLVVGLASLLGVEELGRLRVGAAPARRRRHGAGRLQRLRAAAAHGARRHRADRPAGRRAVPARRPVSGRRRRGQPAGRAAAGAAAVRRAASRCRPGLLVPVALALVIGSAPAGLLLHMKALRRVGGYTAARVVCALLGTPAVLGAAAWGGLRAAVWAMVAQAALYAVGDLVAWRYARRAAAAAAAAST